MEQRLEVLDEMELASVVFVRDYMQLVFDRAYSGNATLSTYTMPTVRVSSKEYQQETPGYRDALCALIGVTVNNATVEEGVALTVQFATGAEVNVSLRDEDMVCAEAAMLQSDHGWWVW